MYAKIKTSTTLEYPPLRVKVGDTYYIPAPDWWCVENGYKEVEDTPEPDPVEGYYWTFEWVETKDDTIYKKWTKHEIVPPQPTEIEVRVNDCEDGILELAEIIGDTDLANALNSTALVRLYVRKITNHEINQATGKEWTIDDVPPRWQDAVREELENA